MDVLGYFFVPDWIVIVILLLTTLYIYFTWNYNYWESQNVKSTRPFPVFSMLALFRQPLADLELKNYKKYGRIYGSFEGRNPSLVLADLELIKTLTIKDFQHFTDRRKMVFTGKSKIANSFLTVMEGEQWKVARSILSPTFTSGRLRQMSSLMEECANDMVKAFSNEVKKNPNDVEVKAKFGTYAMDVIATCCFGYKIDNKNPNDPFIVHAKLLFDQSFSLLIILALVFPKLMQWFDISFFPAKCLNFFQRVVNQVIGMRKQDKIKRNDFLQLMLDAQEAEGKDNILQGNMDPKDHYDCESELKEPLHPLSRGKKVLTEDALVANSILFFLAGFDTTATTVSYVLYEMAINTDCQEKLILEVDQTMEKSGKLNYEAVMGMSYLDKVISETLRIFPVALRLERLCVEDCLLGDIKICKGTMVAIPVYSIHHDEEYYPDPEKFDPERFSPENKAKRNSACYIPFGIGPRNCIGMRFALMEAKIGLAHFFHKFRVCPSEKTEVPLIMRCGVGLLLPKNGVHIKVTEREA